MNTVSNEVLHEPSRFEVAGGTVIDHSTGLMWTRGNVPGGRMTQQAAAEACTKLDCGGHKDWRLPTRKELLTLVDDERVDPSINTAVFECEPSWYWTATPAACSPAGYAWGVLFNFGDTFWLNRGFSGFVRAVHASQ